MLITGKRLKKIKKTKNQTHKLFNKKTNKSNNKRRYKKKSFRRKKRSINLKRKSLKKIHKKRTNMFGGGNDDIVTATVVDKPSNYLNTESEQLLTFTNYMFDLVNSSTKKDLKKYINITKKIKKTNNNNKNDLIKELNQLKPESKSDQNFVKIITKESQNKPIIYKIITSKDLPIADATYLPIAQAVPVTTTLPETVPPYPVRNKNIIHTENIPVKTKKVKVGKKICKRLLQTGKDEYLCLEPSDWDEGIGRIVYVGKINNQEGDLFDYLKAPNTVKSWIYSFNKDLDGWTPMNQLLKKWDAIDTNVESTSIESQ